MKENTTKQRKSNSKQQTNNVEFKDIPPKYGPLPKLSNQRIWSRMVLILGALVVVYFTSGKERIITLAKQSEILENRVQNVDCSPDYKQEIEQYEGCAPLKCGRIVMDKLITNEEAEDLLDLAKRGFALGASDGGASIFDLHSGALSVGKQLVRKKIEVSIVNSFQLTTSSLYLTYPTFFSRLTSDPPFTLNDEYWHEHVDKETYRSFHYTSLLYLNNYNSDFKGGRFMFIEKENTSVAIEPRKGRVSIFTSGAENPHKVEKVTNGERYAITISFTCEKKFATSDPSIPEILTT